MWVCNSYQVYFVQKDKCSLPSSFEPINPLLPRKALILTLIACKLGILMGYWILAFLVFSIFSKKDGCCFPTPALLSWGEGLLTRIFQLGNGDSLKQNENLGFRFRMECLVNKRLQNSLVLSWEAGGLGLCPFSFRFGEGL